MLTRRRMLFTVSGCLVMAGLTADAGFELVEHGVLPGRYRLDRLLGDCAISTPRPELYNLGPSHSGSFYSDARHRRVRFRIAYPPGTSIGDTLPLVIFLHGEGGNSSSSVCGLSLEQVAAVHVAGMPVPNVAFASIDGGRGYWNRHSLDDPMEMLIREFLPLCRRRGLGVGVAERTVASLGVSMGGYGALLLAQKIPREIAAVACVSPAVWRSYAQARDANPDAFASARSFAHNNVIMHASRLKGIPIRIACGTDDPFYPDMADLAAAMPDGTITDFSRGCHDGDFFRSQLLPTVSFLRSYLP